MATPVAPKPVKPAAKPVAPKVTTGTTRPSGTTAQTAKPVTKSPVGPNSGYLQNTKPLTTGQTGSKITPPAAPPAGPTVDALDANANGIPDWFEKWEAGQGAAQTDPATAELLRRDEANRVSAFKVLEDTFNSYGLGSLAATVKTFMQQGLSDDEAVIQLRQTPEYKQRFLGNEGRRAKGLYAYSESQYLEAEQTYRDLFAQSGLESLAGADTFSKLIGGAVSPAETQDRIQNVFTKIDNADPQLREQIGSYLTGYGIGDPNVQRTQLASALLMGGTSAQDLVRNIEKAQIKTAALTSGMTLAEENISSLQKQLETAKTYDVYGTSKKAFGELAQTTPTTEKLANIYGEDTTNLSSELQQEAFFGLQSQRRKKLQEKEKSTFGGSAGTSTASLAQNTKGAI
jgi:hypothetical protein